MEETTGPCRREFEEKYKRRSLRKAREVCKNNEYEMGSYISNIKSRIGWSQIGWSKIGGNMWAGYRWAGHRWGGQRCGYKKGGHRWWSYIGYRNPNAA